MSHLDDTFGEQGMVIPQHGEGAQEGSLNPFVHGCPWKGLCNPHVWHHGFGWAAWIPTEADFSVFPLNRVAAIPPLQFDKNDKLYSLPNATIPEWDDICNRLLLAADVLLGTYCIPAVRCYSPRAWRFGNRFKSARRTRRMILESRNWFLVWMGLLSFSIAFVHKFRPHQPNTQKKDPFSSLPPHWRVRLREEGFSEGWLDALHAMAMAKVERAGVFIPNFDVIRRDDSLPDLLWWLNNGVAVWCGWTQDIPDGEPIIEVCEANQEVFDVVQDTLPPSLEPTSPHEDIVCTESLESMIEGVEEPKVDSTEHTASDPIFSNEKRSLFGKPQ
ncbi:hypothetical protein NMY22_g9647 [Coprinellus aureogranulatus]|nr:hypothetical protein NMY22_g9647 [Coprinellus aureogranulatus]